MPIETPEPASEKPDRDDGQEYVERNSSADWVRKRVRMFRRLHEQESGDREQDRREADDVLDKVFREQEQVDRPFNFQAEWMELCGQHLSDHLVD